MRAWPVPSGYAVPNSSRDGFDDNQAGAELAAHHDEGRALPGRLEQVLADLPALEHGRAQVLPSSLSDDASYTFPRAPYRELGLMLPAYVQEASRLQEGDLGGRATLVPLAVVRTRCVAVRGVRLDDDVEAREQLGELDVGDVSPLRWMASRRAAQCVPLSVSAYLVPEHGSADAIGRRVHAILRVPDDRRHVARWFLRVQVPRRVRSAVQQHRLQLDWGRAAVSVSSRAFPTRTS